MPSPLHSSYAWRVLAKQVIAEEYVCYLCGYDVDKTLHYLHDYSPTADHVIAYKLRPDLALVRDNIRLAHRICNLRKSKKILAYKANSSRNWLMGGDGSKS